MTTRKLIAVIALALLLSLSMQIVARVLVVVCVAVAIYAAYRAWKCGPGEDEQLPETD